MYIHKLIEIGIDIENPIPFFADPNNNLLRYLKEIYEKKCFRSCFIIEVLRIIKQSEPIIDQEQDHCFAKINIQFEVSAIVYILGDIINGCTVINKDKTGSILCISKYACIGLKAHKYFQGVQLNQLISVVVGDANYHPGSSQISIKGLPLLFTDPIIYYIDPSKFTSEQKESIDDIILSITNEENLKGDIPERAWQFFDDRLYSYREKMEQPKNVVEMSIFKLSVAGWFSRDPKIRLSKPIMYYYKDPPDKPVSTTDSFESYLAILNNYHNIIRTIREMTEIYNTEELMQSHNNIWRIFDKFKLE